MDSTEVGVNNKAMKTIRIYLHVVLLFFRKLLNVSTPSMTEFGPAKPHLVEIIKHGIKEPSIKKRMTKVNDNKLHLL